MLFTFTKDDPVVVQTTVIKIAFFDFGLSICFRAGKVIETSRNCSKVFGEKKKPKKGKPGV